MVACVKYQTQLTWGGYRVKTPFSNLVTVLSYKEKGYLFLPFCKFFKCLYLSLLPIRNQWVPLSFSFGFSDDVDNTNKDKHRNVITSKANSFIFL